MQCICNICKGAKDESEVITLSCNHKFCWTCIEEHLKKTLQNKNKCPLLLCSKLIKDSEIRKILSDEDIERFDKICLAMLSNTHTCVLPGCGTVTIYKDLNTQFDCNVCSVFNCINCKLAHKGMSCGDKLSRTGLSLADVCQTEMERAGIILQSKKAKVQRANIIESDKVVLTPNPCIFTCDVCGNVVGKHCGVTLRNCFHLICRTCLGEHVKMCSSIPVPCPFSPCKSTLEDRECREILSDADRAVYETKSIKRASVYLDRAQRCRQVNCSYMCDLAADVRSWSCPKCKSVNCVSCNVIHNNQTCQEYTNSKIMSTDEEKIEEQIKKKELMRCPDCRTLLKKTRGCNWIPCSSCGVELCWINQTYRWGPKGPGDTSGGCKCGVGGQMCHPSCGGCIADRGRRHSRYASLQGADASANELDLPFGLLRRLDDRTGGPFHRYPFLADPNFDRLRVPPPPRLVTAVPRRRTSASYAIRTQRQRAANRQPAPDPDNA